MTHHDGMTAWKEAAKIVEANSDDIDLFAENMHHLFKGDAGVPAGLFMLVLELTRRTDSNADALGHMGITGFIAGMLYERDRT